MGKNKLKKFAELAELPRVYQYPREKLLAESFPYKGKWAREVFDNDNRLILELGCGKGEYTVSLAKTNPHENYIGIDIKGARLWSGAKEIADSDIKNAAFIRTEIENICHFFEEDEVSEIWITFPDPQMQKARKRLTGSLFMKLYAKILKPGGFIHLKTDSPFLYEYTCRLVKENKFEVITDTDDLYGSGEADPVKSIKTFYESQWLSRGKKIKMLSFRPDFYSEVKEPFADDIEKDDYRAYSRHTPINKNKNSKL